MGTGRGFGRGFAIGLALGLVPAAIVATLWFTLWRSDDDGKSAVPAADHCSSDAAFTAVVEELEPDLGGAGYFDHYEARGCAEGYVVGVGYPVAETDTSYVVLQERAGGWSAPELYAVGSACGESGLPAAVDQLIDCIETAPPSPGLDTYAFISDWSGTIEYPDEDLVAEVGMQVGSTYDPPPPPEGDGTIVGDFGVALLDCYGSWDETSHDDTQVTATLVMNDPGRCGSPQTITLRLTDEDQLLVQGAGWSAVLERSDD